MTDSQKGEDSKSGPVSVIVQQTGLPGTLKGHAQRFVMRWLAGTIAHPYFITVRDNLDTIEGRSRVNMMLAEEVGRQAIADPAQIERAKARFLGDLSRKQENIEAVGQAAAAKVEEQAGSEAEAQPKSEPSPDFMNAFTREAEDASSEQLRERFASILAGEIKRPGTFSRAALRLAGEIEQEDLQGFKQALSNRVRNRICVPPSWQEGDNFLLGLRLEELGLMSGTSGTSHNFTLDQNLNGFMLGDRYGMAVFAKNNSAIHTNIWLISKVGLELATLLPDNDERVPLRQIAADIDKSNIKKIFIGQVTLIGNGMANVANDELLYTDPVPPVMNPLPPGLVTLTPKAVPPDRFGQP